MNEQPDRAELERLDRDALIARAEAAGVTRANILTRPELVDELLLRSARKDDPRLAKARGFFGRARDLLARVIERGLHLPEAAERFRSMSSPPPPTKRSAPAAVPTVTLAEIYAAQGHTTRAKDTLKRVLEHEPEHETARSLLTKLDDGSGDPSRVTGPNAPAEGEETRDTAGESVPPPSASMPPEPHGFLDDDLLPGRYDVDECVAVPVDPTTLFVYWEVRESTVAHLRRTRPDGEINLRVLIITSSWEGPRSSSHDVEVKETLGDWFVRGLPAGAVVRTAIGWKAGGVFLPIAHSPALETPADQPSPMLVEAYTAFSPTGMRSLPTSHEAASRVPFPYGQAGARAARGPASGGGRGRPGGKPGPGGVDEPMGSSEIFAGPAPRGARPDAARA